MSVVEHVSIDQDTPAPVTKTQQYTQFIHKTLETIGISDETFKATNYRSFAALGGYTSNITALCFSPCGTFLASASVDLTVRIWDLRSCKIVATAHSLHRLGLNAVKWSPNGLFLAIASDDTYISIWSTSVLYQENPLHDVILHNTLSTDEKHHVYNTLPKVLPRQELQHISLTPIRLLRAHTNYVSCLSFSPLSSILVSGSFDETICIWDVLTGACIHQIDAHSQPVIGIDMSSCGSMFCSASLDGVSRIWDVRTGQCLSTMFSDQSLTASGVKFTPNSNYVLTSYLCSNSTHKYTLPSTTTSKPITQSTQSITQPSTTHSNDNITQKSSINEEFESKTTHESPRTSNLDTQDMSQTGVNFGTCITNQYSTPTMTKPQKNEEKPKTTQDFHTTSQDTSILTKNDTTQSNVTIKSSIRLWDPRTNTFIREYTQHSNDRYLTSFFIFPPAPVFLNLQGLKQPVSPFNLGHSKRLLNLAKKFNYSLQKSFLANLYPLNTTSTNNNAHNFLSSQSFQSSIQSTTPQVSTKKQKISSTNSSSSTSQIFQHSPSNASSDTSDTFLNIPTDLSTFSNSSSSMTVKHEITNNKICLDNFRSNTSSTFPTPVLYTLSETGHICIYDLDSMVLIRSIPALSLPLHFFKTPTQSQSQDLKSTNNNQTLSSMDQAHDGTQYTSENDHNSILNITTKNEHEATKNILSTQNHGFLLDASKSLSELLQENILHFESLTKQSMRNTTNIQSTTSQTFVEQPSQDNTSESIFITNMKSQSSPTIQAPLVDLVPHPTKNIFATAVNSIYDSDGTLVIQPIIHLWTS